MSRSIIVLPDDSAKPIPSLLDAVIAAPISIASVPGIPLELTLS